MDRIDCPICALIFSDTGEGPPSCSYCIDEELEREEEGDRIESDLAGRMHA